MVRVVRKGMSLGREKGKLEGRILVFFESGKSKYRIWLV